MITNYSGTLHIQIFLEKRRIMHNFGLCTICPIVWKINYAENYACAITHNCIIPRTLITSLSY